MSNWFTVELDRGGEYLIEAEVKYTKTEYVPASRWSPAVHPEIEIESILIDGEEADVSDAELALIEAAAEKRDYVADDNDDADYASDARYEQYREDRYERYGY